MLNSRFLQKTNSKNEQILIRYKTYGNPEGIPVLYLHGGPGAGFNDNITKFFNLEKYFLVSFDQRGCGFSTPSAINTSDITDNSTWDLVEDINDLLNVLKIDKFVLFGGSWGSTLALVYAIQNSHRILKLVLRGVYLCRSEDIDFLYEGGTKNNFPEVYAKYSSFIKDNYPDVLDKNKDKDHPYLHTYYQILGSQDQSSVEEAAKTFAYHESFIASNSYQESNLEDDIKFAVLETHYFVNRCFLETDNYILENAYKIANIDTYIVHGRNDSVCKPSSAFDLSLAIGSKARLYITNGYHSGYDFYNKEKTLEIFNQISEDLFGKMPIKQ
ncbi:prolyl aminopeptidase [Mycoplasma sp. Ms02]|uniref:prolyl aminopeptidase n=1 Tax=Mycoplasma sp. Ms02 TaxID=353851 RepID=UPI001C8A1606|nr:prolyl aminopeptidase [Mycoplasma sp. Ms02]QZE12171.1 prolyl aminopeptidase [Mycoplasma sp. Ms02]